MDPHTKTDRDASDDLSRPLSQKQHWVPPEIVEPPRLFM